jgi:lysyl-tRNA synthetase class II
MAEPTDSGSSAWHPSHLEQQRLEKLAQLQDAGIDPFPLRAGRTHTTAAAIDLFEAAETQRQASGDSAAATGPIPVTVAGRLVSLRDMGKTVFAHIDATSTPRLPRSRDAGAPADLRRRGRAALHHPPQPA